MYTEEHLPDDAIDYFDVTDVSIDETSTMNSEQRNRKKINELYKLGDPNYYYYKIREYNENDKVRMRKIPIYSSSIGGKIRNATTGIREDDRVGSKYEDLYFVVKDTSLYTKTETNNEPRKLFYRDPEECERHLQLTLPRSVKEAWYNKEKSISLLKK